MGWSFSIPHSERKEPQRPPSTWAERLSMKSVTSSIDRHLGDTNDCSGSDHVADTPQAQLPNYNKPTFPHVSCNNAPNGDMFMNYMDYVDDDSMFMFTLGQADRIGNAGGSARQPGLIGG